MKKYNRSEIMKKAWGIRRTNNVSMSVALKAAWALAKGGSIVTKTYNWTTQRGAKISATITVEHITTKIADADGFKLPVKCSEWVRTVNCLTVNGKETEMHELYNERGTRCILIGRVGKDRVLVALPADVVDSVYGEEIAENKRKIDHTIKVENAAAAHRAAVYKMMNP